MVILPLYEGWISRYKIRQLVWKASYYHNPATELCRLGEDSPLQHLGFASLFTDWKFENHLFLAFCRFSQSLLPTKLDSTHIHGSRSHCLKRMFLWEKNKLELPQQFQWLYDISRVFYLLFDQKAPVALSLCVWDVLIAEMLAARRLGSNWQPRKLACPKKSRCCCCCWWCSSQ